MIVLGLEEFASRRRGEQQRIEEALHPIVARSVDPKVNSGGYSELLNEVAAQWAIVYRDESGGRNKRLPMALRDAFHRTLRKTDRAEATEVTVERIAIWLATAILSNATMAAAQDDPEELFVEWVDMGDSKVRHAHAVANGQQRPIGEKFTVGGEKMWGPGDPSVDIALWINCRCTLRPVLASEAIAAAVGGVGPCPVGPPGAVEFGEREGGGYPINNCSDLKNAIQAIGRAKPGDRAKTIAHIKSEKKRLGCPEVELPDTWAADWAPNAGVFYIPEKMSYAPGSGSDPKFLEALLAATTEPLKEPTHAGIAVQAADSKRILLMQRAWDEDDAPDVRGTWEFPGGGLEDGETPEAGARREFAEETGCPVPEGEITNGWRSEDGVYQGFVLTVPVEADAFEELNPAESDTVNPDDPERETPEVTAWFTIQQIKGMGAALRPEVAKTDWSLFDGGDTMTDTDEKPDFEPVEGEEPTFVADPPMQWHGVLAPEGVWSGDKRMFAIDSLRHRPLPLPLTYQKFSDDGHKGNVTWARIDRVAKVDGEFRGTGEVLSTAEADEVVGLLAAFGRFGVSVDADDVTFEMNDEMEGLVFTDARVSSACVVAIPAFAEAWVSLGAAPEGFMPEGGEEDPCENRDEDGECLDEVERTEEEKALVASMQAAKTEDGPGWLTHPVDTDRLRDYWVRGAGAAKINWGTPGDFNRCRALVAEYVKPQHLNGYCANRHYDALGTWPGRGAHAADSMEFTEPAEALTIVASAVPSHAPAAWFKNPEFKRGDGRLVKYKGTWACPMTITEEGQVFGHLAAWNTCHQTWADKCVLAPKSQTQYAHFLLGEVLTDEGPVAVGNLTIGGGHANGRLGMRPAIEHYDSTSAVFADVVVGEDEFGIWFAGWVRPGTDPAMIHAARASKLSGDWRRNPQTRSLELVAALAVNTPGYQVPRIAAAVEGGEQISLVAAGVVTPEEGTPEATPEFDYALLAAAVAKELSAIQARKTLMAEIQASVEEGFAAAAEKRKIAMAGIVAEALRGSD